MDNNKAFSEMSTFEMEELALGLETANIQRNIVTAGEFEKYRPLFEPHKDFIDYDELSHQFQLQFNVYAPIAIVDKRGEGGKTLYVIPAIMTPLKTLNQLGTEATTAIDIYSNAYRRDENPLRNDRDIAKSKLMKHFVGLSDTDKVERTKRMLDGMLGAEDTDPVDFDSDFTWG